MIERLYKMISFLEDIKFDDWTQISLNYLYKKGIIIPTKDKKKKV